MFKLGKLLFYKNQLTDDSAQSVQPMKDMFGNTQLDLHLYLQIPMIFL